jgi:hypothetical protein
MGDDPEKTWTAGQMFLETPGQLHAVSGNASSTRPAVFLGRSLQSQYEHVITSYTNEC